MTIDREKLKRLKERCGRIEMMRRNGWAGNPVFEEHDVSDLIAEIERLDGFDKAYAEVWEKARGLQSEMDAVMAENEALRKDAERYRFIRSYYAKFSVEIAIPGFESDWLTGDQADKEIDAAMAREAQP